MRKDLLSIDKRKNIKAMAGKNRQRIGGKGKTGLYY